MVLLHLIILTLSRILSKYAQWYFVQVFLIREDVQCPSRWVYALVCRPSSSSEMIGLSDCFAEELSLESGVSYRTARKKVTYLGQNGAQKFPKPSRIGSMQKISKCALEVINVEIIPNQLLQVGILISLLWQAAREHQLWCLWALYNLWSDTAIFIFVRQWIMIF